jgi:DHA1 family bicyclomycin/chloramphenicol resistance-like MFS transporter
MPTARTVATGGLLAGLVAYSSVSTDLYLPSLPSLADYFETDAGTVQLTLSLFFGGFAVSQLAYGPLSDRFGRLPVLYAGLVLYLLASVGCALAPSIELLIAGRFVQAIGACAGPVLARAMVRDLYGAEQAPRVLAYLATVMGILPIIMPIAGSVLTAEFGWRANFVALAGYAAVTILGTLALLRETNQWRDPEAAHPRALARTYLGLLRNRRFLGYATCLSFIFGGLVAYIANISFVLIDYAGVPVEAFGLYFAASVFAFIGSTFVAGRITLRLGTDRMITIGGLVCLLGGLAVIAVAFAEVRAGWAYVLAIVPFLGGLGFVFPNAMGAAIAPFQRQAGAASALAGFIQMAIGGLTVFATGALADGTPRVMAVTVLVLAMLSTGSFFALTRTAPDAVAADQTTP